MLPHPLQRLNALIAHAYNPRAFLAMKVTNYIRPPIAIANDTNAKGIVTAVKVEMEVRRSLRVETSSHCIHLAFINLIRCIAGDPSLVCSLRSREPNEVKSRFANPSVKFAFPAALMRAITRKDCKRGLKENL